MDEVEALLPVGPWAAAAVATVLVVALSIPPGGPRAATTSSGLAPLAMRLGAALMALVALLAVVVGRLGPSSELRNPVPALLLGLGWPLLLLVPTAIGLVRGAKDSAEAAGAENGAERPDVWPAVAAMLAVVGFLVLAAPPTVPTSLATAVAAYALVVLAASVAFGRRVVAARGEVLGLLASWCAVGRALPRWAAPRGALAVLAVLLGGSWFERYERSTAWMENAYAREETAIGLLVALLLAGLAAAALHLATRRAGSPGTAAAVLLPLAVGLTVAGVVRRALISAQLLADQAAGPRPIDPDPLGLVGGQVLALALLGMGAALAAAVLARRTGEGAARLPGVGVLLVLTGASAWLVLQP